MTRRTKSKIEQVANQVLARYSVTQEPCRSIPSVCKAESILLRHAKLQNGIDGMFCLIGEQKAVFYNESKPPARQTFTKAHEVGHYFLEHSLTQGPIICNFDPQNQQLPWQETEANYFAAYYLMPEKLVVNGYIEVAKSQNRRVGDPLYADRQQCNYSDWLATCAYFYQKLGVSKEALRYRLESMGLLRYNM